MSEKRIGIIGCSTILPRAIINPLKEVPDFKLYGLASRSNEKAVQYSQEYEIPNVFKTYDDLLSCNEIDAVYIALPNHIHTEWIIRAARAKKHILIEKPLCLKYDDIFYISDECRRSSIYILEGLMVQHHPWQKAIKDIIITRKYGKLNSLKTNICIIPKYDLQNNYRSDPKRGGGVFYDLGCYWLQFVQYIIGLNPASYVGYSSFSGTNDCDWTFDAHMLFDGGLSSDFVCSYEMPYKVEHILEFDSAVIKVNDFFRANLGNYKITLSIDNLVTGEREKVVFEPQNYYVNQLKFFSDVIDGVTENISLCQSFERIMYAERIMNIAIRTSVNNGGDMI